LDVISALPLQNIILTLRFCCSLLVSVLFKNVGSSAVAGLAKGTGKSEGIGRGYNGKWLTSTYYFGGEVLSSLPFLD